MKSLLLAVSALMVLAGCIAPGGSGHHHDGGGVHHGGDRDTGDGDLRVAGDESMMVDVRGGIPSEYRFTPARIDVGAGERVAIAFLNEGEYAHEFAIDAIAFRLHAEPGESKSGAFIAPSPGEYIVGCYLPGHFESGMKAVLVVT